MTVDQLILSLITLLIRALSLVLLLLGIILATSIRRWAKIFIGILFVGGILILICYLCGVSRVTFGFNFLLLLPFIIRRKIELIRGIEERLLSPPYHLLLLLIIFILLALSFLSYSKPLRGV